MSVCYRLAFALMLFTFLGEPARPVFAQLSNEFESLIQDDGLSGWVEMGEPGAFEVEDGVLRLAHPQNYPNWLRSERAYENFVLELEYRPLGWAEGGIYLHAPLHGDPIRSGIKIHLRHDQEIEGTRTTGGLYDIRPPDSVANEPGDTWNSLRIRMEWPRLQVHMNGVLIHDLDLEASEDLRYRLRSGYLGIEDCGTTFEFRNIRIRELRPSEAEWVELFNGQDLSGWEAEGDARWDVQDGKLVTGGGDGVLATTRSFEGFEFRTYFRTTPHANGGIFYRLADRAEEPGHYEVQIYNVPTATNPTGSIYGIVPATDAGCRSGEWCLLQLISDGPYSRVIVNGRTVAESEDLSLPDSGKIAIQNHSEGTIEYKGLVLKHLEN